MNDENVSLGFDDAIGSGFLSLPDGEPVDVVLSNVRFERVPEDAKFHAGEVALVADVVEEGGVACEKLLQVTSKRLLRALRPFLEKNGELISSRISLRLVRVGDKYDTQYSVRALKK